MGLPATGHAVLRRPLTSRSHWPIRFQLAKMRLTSLRSRWYAPKRRGVPRRRSGPGRMGTRLGAAEGPSGEFGPPCSNTATDQQPTGPASLLIRSSARDDRENWQSPVAQSHFVPSSRARLFTGSSRKARYAGTRLAISATRASVAPTAASVSGSDALTPKTSVSNHPRRRERGDCSGRDADEHGRHALDDHQTKDVGFCAPSALLIPISRLRPRTMYESTL